MKKMFSVFVLTGLVLLALPAQVYYSGTGGSGITIAVLQPEGQGIESAQAWLLPLIQGSLTGDFQKYSAMTVIDRQNLDKTLSEIEFSEQGYTAEEGAPQIGKMLNAQYILSGTLTKPPSGSSSAYYLELAVTDVESGERKASYSPAECSLASLQNLSAVKSAAIDLLGQLGVTLNSAGKEALYGITTAEANAEAALAKGITAEDSGEIVAALNYYYQASSLDKSLAEAAARASTVSATITSGSLGTAVRNDIQRRNDWLKILREAAAYYTAHPPFIIYYDPANLEWGNIDYDKNTTDLSFRCLFSPDPVAWKVIFDIRMGLLNTGRSFNEFWGFWSWPNYNTSSSSKLPQDAALFNHDGNGHYWFSMNFNLTDSSGKLLGSAQASGRMYIPELYNIQNAYDDPIIDEVFPYPLSVTFKSINADAITDEMNVTLTQVNGVTIDAVQNYIMAETCSLTCFSADEWEDAIDSPTDNMQWIGSYLIEYKFLNTGEWGISIYSTRVNATSLSVPSEFGPLKVIEIGDRVYAKGRGYGYQEITGIYIPDGIINIGSRAFSKNQLTEVIIPNSVKLIEHYAFTDNPITKITIGADVTLYYENAYPHTGAFDNNFNDYYNNNGKRAGTYTYNTAAKTWRYTPR